jgi:hypothetical protein
MVDIDKCIIRGLLPNISSKISREYERLFPMFINDTFSLIGRHSWLKIVTIKIARIGQDTDNII